MVACLAIGTFSGCASETQDDAPSGSLTMNLQLPGSVEIDEVAYEVSGNGTVPRSGIINTAGAGSTASFTVSLPVGLGYLVKLSAVSVDGERSCSGSAPFNITVGETTTVSVSLNCIRTGQVQVDGTFNNCAELVSPSASPREAYMGEAINLSVSGVDDDGDPIDYAWTGPGGSFADPSAATTTYTCFGTGSHTLSVAVSDDQFIDCAEVWTVAVDCLGPEPQWGTEELISDVGASVARAVRATVDDDGVVTAIWVQQNNILVSNRYTPTVGWGTSEVISTPQVPLVPEEFQVSAGPNGTAMAIWTLAGEFPSSVRSSLYTPGSGWSPAELVELDDTGDASFPQVVVEDSGDAIAVWGQTVGAVVGSIYTNRYTAGVGWGAPERLDTDDATPFSSPQNLAPLVGQRNRRLGWSSVYSSQPLHASRWLGGTGEHRHERPFIRVRPENRYGRHGERSRGVGADQSSGVRAS